MSLTFTATATTHYFVIEKEAIPSMTLGSCNQLEVDDVVLTQANTINDNFATIGNTAGYIGTNATLSNTNNTLEIATGIAPVVSKIYNGIAGGKYNINFDLIAGDCAPLSLISKYVRYDLVYNGASILSGNVISSTQLSNITLPATGTYTLQFSIINKMATPLACQLAIDNIQWNRTLFKDEFATLAGWTAYAGTGSVASLSLVSGTMQYNAGIGSKSFIGARRTLPALSQNKTYTLNARLLKSTCIVNNSIIVRVRSALNGTILGTTSYTIATNTAASVPITMNFVAPSNLSTAIVEIERAASTNCPNIQIDDVELIEQRTVWEDFATLDNTSGYSANTGSNVVLANTNQSLQIAPTLLSASNGIRKNIDLEAGTEYTFSYDIAAQTPLSNKNYILCELFYGTNALYSYKIMSTQSNSFVYTPTSSGTYTWRFRRVCTGATAPASSYTVDNLKVSYVIPYTRTECPETDLAYRFGFNGKEKESDMYGESNAYDFGARIHDARIGRFLSVDPHVHRYPSMSGYSAFANNPINVIDPDGRDIIPVHGTYSNEGTWKNLNLIRSASNNLFKDNVLGTSFHWSGGNNAKSRTTAALELVSQVRTQMKSKSFNGKITLVGHSHGGNVSIEALNKIVEMKEFDKVQFNLLTINTPVREDYQLSEKASKRVSHVHVYDTKDPVQISGGTSHTIMPVVEDDSKLSIAENFKKRHDFKSRTDITEVGSAGRTFKNAKNIEVDNPQSALKDFHNSHNRVNDWIDKTKKK